MSWSYICWSIPHVLKHTLIVSWRSLIFHWVAQIVRALDLVGSDNISVVSLDPLTRLEEVAEDLVKNSNVIEASVWVGTLDPYQVPPIILTLIL